MRGNNASSFIVNFEKDIWRFNGDFVPYALASLGPAIAEGGGEKHRREKHILASKLLLQ